jgi:hypothetical protein
VLNNANKVLGGNAKAALRGSVDPGLEEYLFAGYHDFYDYAISSKLVDALGKHGLKFESIPRIYIYVSKSDPRKINIVLTKLKKSAILIGIFNNTLDKLGKPDTNKTVQPILPNERESISDADYDKIIALIHKHNLPAFKVDLIGEFSGPILAYYRYLDLFKVADIFNVIWTKAEIEALKIPQNMRLPKDAEAGLLFQTNSPDQENEQDQNMTGLLNRDGLTFNIIADAETRDYLIKSGIQALDHNIQTFLFNNPRLGTNISPERIALFKLDIINPYSVAIFYKLKDYTGALELTNKELQTKLDTVFIPDMSFERLKEADDLKRQNPNAIVSFKPDMYFYMRYNSFQLTKVIVKHKESELGLS